MADPITTTTDTVTAAAVTESSIATPPPVLQSTLVQPQASPASQSERSFSQSDVERIIKERLERQARELTAARKTAEQERDAAIRERDSLRVARHADMVRSAIARAAGPRTVDLAIVTQALESQVRVDDGGHPYVVNASGDREDRSIDTLVTEFLNAKPYLAAPSRAQGSGSGTVPGAAQIAQPQSVDYSKMPFNSPEAMAHRRQMMEAHFGATKG